MMQRLFYWVMRTCWKEEKLYTYHLCHMLNFQSKIHHHLISLISNSYEQYVHPQNIKSPSQYLFNSHQSYIDYNKNNFLIIIHLIHEQKDMVALIKVVVELNVNSMENLVTLWSPIDISLIETSHLIHQHNTTLIHYFLHSFNQRTFLNHQLHLIPTLILL